jgi:hypothetical protein
MGLVADIITFKTGTGIAGSTVDLSFPNHETAEETPKVLWFYGVGRTDITDAVGAIDVNSHYGFTVSTTKRRVLAGQSATGISPSSTDAAFRNDAVMLSLSALGAVNGLLDLNSLSVGAGQVVVDQQFAADLTVVCVALGGSEISNADIVDFNVVSGSTGGFSITVGFVPKYIEVLSPFRTGGFQTLSATWTGSIGRCDTSSFLNQCLGYGTIDASATVDSFRSLNDVNWYEYHNAAANVDVRGRVTALTANGFTHTVQEEGVAGTRQLSALCLAGFFLMSMGNFNTPTDTTTTSDVSMTFSPVLTHLWGHCTTETTANTNQAVMRISIGSFLDYGSGSQAGIAWVDPETNPSSSASAFSISDSYLDIADDGTLDASGGADGGEVPPETGFRFKMSDDDAGAAFVTYVSFGDSGLSDVIKRMNVGRRGGGVGFRKWN